MTEDEIKQKYKDNVYYKRNSEMFALLVDVVECHVDSYAQRLRKSKYDALKLWLYDQLPFLDNEQYTSIDYPLKEVIYLVMQGMTDFPKCAVCEKRIVNPARFMSIVSGFALCCSDSCTKKKRCQSFRETSLRQYGTVHPLKSKAGYQHYCDALEKSHGVRNVFQLETTKAQIKATILENHGDANFHNVEKSRKTRALHFNGHWENDDVKKKRKASFKSHYGVDNNMKSEIGRQEYRAGVEKKYGKGITSLSQVPEIRCKQKSKYRYDERSFDSAPEIAFYIWLKDTGIEFEYKPKMFFSYAVDGVLHRYFPDFKVGDMVFELKGDQFFNKNGVMQNPYNHLQDKCFAEKQKCMLANDVIVLKSAEYQMFELYVAQKYGCNYLKQFKMAKKKDIAQLNVNNGCNEERSKRQQA